jgi:DNA topoisomerase-2
MTSGIIEYAGKYTYTISELPIGYDRSAYVSMLNDMCDKDLIRDYTDECSEDGFGFSIKTTGAQKEKIDKDPMKYFKLQKTFTENLTTLGTDGKLKIFKSVAELIVYFCDFRLTKFDQKLKYDIDKLENEILYLIDKSRFIADVVYGKIELQKTTKQNLIEYIETHITKAEYGKKYISIPIYECTSDSIKELEFKVETLRATRDELMKQTPDKIFTTKLAGIK